MALEAELQRADADAGCSRQLREIEEWGGRFVTPVPMVRIHDLQ